MSGTSSVKLLASHLLLKGLHLGVRESFFSGCAGGCAKQNGSFLRQFLAFPVWGGSGFCTMQLNPDFTYHLGVPPE